MDTHVAMGKGRIRPSVHRTISSDSENYLKQFDNQSKIIDEALELHRNKDKMTMKPVRGEVIRIV